MVKMEIAQMPYSKVFREVTPYMHMTDNFEQDYKIGVYTGACYIGEGVEQVVWIPYLHPQWEPGRGEVAGKLVFEYLPITEEGRDTTIVVATIVGYIEE